MPEKQFGTETNGGKGGKKTMPKRPCHAKHKISHGDKRNSGDDRTREYARCKPEYNKLKGYVKNEFVRHPNKAPRYPKSFPKEKKNCLTPYPASSSLLNTVTHMANDPHAASMKNI